VAVEECAQLVLDVFRSAKNAKKLGSQLVIVPGFSHDHEVMQSHY
jgi:hypothetical protein